MIDGLPKGELVLLCDNSYLVEKVLYSNLRFDHLEILNKSLISLADVQSFDAVLQLVANLRSEGSSAGRAIQLILGEKSFQFLISGTSLQEHIVLTASVEVSEMDLIPGIDKYKKTSGEGKCSPGKLASDDLVLMEEVKQLKNEVCSINLNDLPSV